MPACEGESPPWYVVVVRQLNNRPVMRLTFRVPTAERASALALRVAKLKSQRVTDYIQVAETIYKPVVLVRGDEEQRVSIPRQN